MGGALTWLVGNTTVDDHFVILTDSLSLVSKLQRGFIKKDWFPLLRRIPAHTEVIYVPGHARIRYEKADWLAGKVTNYKYLTEIELVMRLNEKARCKNRYMYRPNRLSRIYQDICVSVY
jgi:hypothetical protein